MDAGAIIVQEVVEIHVGDTADSLQARIHKAEHRALPKAVQLICLEKISFDKNLGKIIWK